MAQAACFLPRPRNVYLSLRGAAPVAGLEIAQQLMKIAAAATSDADLVVHADSEWCFSSVRPDRRTFLLDGKPRFLREPGAGESPMHAALASRSLQPARPSRRVTITVRTISMQVLSYGDARMSPG